MPRVQSSRHLRTFACLSLFAESDDCTLASLIRCAAQELARRHHVYSDSRASPGVASTLGKGVLHICDFQGRIFPFELAPFSISEDGALERTPAGIAYELLLGGRSHRGSEI